jgi:hypothetical protein
MTKGDSAAWLVARRALDNRETVDALTDAMPGAVAYADDPSAQRHLATELAAELAAELARSGLVLVRMDVEQARDFFSRKEDT